MILVSFFFCGGGGALLCFYNFNCNKDPCLCFRYEGLRDGGSFILYFQ